MRPVKGRVAPHVSLTVNTTGGTSIKPLPVSVAVAYAGGEMPLVCV